MPKDVIDGSKTTTTRNEVTLVGRIGGERESVCRRLGRVHDRRSQA